MWKKIRRNKQTELKEDKKRRENSIQKCLYAYDPPEDIGYRNCFWRRQANQTAVYALPNRRRKSTDWLTPGFWIITGTAFFSELRMLPKWNKMTFTIRPNLKSRCSCGVRAYSWSSGCVSSAAPLCAKVNARTELMLYRRKLNLEGSIYPVSFIGSPYKLTRRDPSCRLYSRSFSLMQLIAFANTGTRCFAQPGLWLAKSNMPGQYIHQHKGGWNHGDY